MWLGSIYLCRAQSGLSVLRVIDVSAASLHLEFKQHKLAEESCKENKNTISTRGSVHRFCTKEETAANRFWEKTLKVIMWRHIQDKTIYLSFQIKNIFEEATITHLQKISVLRYIDGGSVICTYKLDSNLWSMRCKWSLCYRKLRLWAMYRTRPHTHTHTHTHTLGSTDFRRTFVPLGRI